MVRLGNYVVSAGVRNKGARNRDVYSVTNSRGFVPSTEYFNKEVFSKELSSYRLVERGMIAYNPSRINVGSVALQDVKDEVVVSPLYVVFSVDRQKLLPEYLLRYLKSQPGLEQIKFRSTGTVRNNLKIDGLRQLEIAIPSVVDQQDRVNKLGAVECRVTEANSMLNMLDSLVKSRFVEMFGDLKRNAKTWPMAKFDDFALIDTHMTKDFKRYARAPHIGIDSIQSNTGELINYRTVAEDGVISGKYPFDERHIIYSKIRPNLNKVALPSFSGICSADAYPILPIAGKCTREYLAYVMRSNYFLDYILPLSARAQMPKVNQRALRGFTMPIPPLALQREFADFVAEVDKSRFVAERLRNLYFHQIKTKRHGHEVSPS